MRREKGIFLSMSVIGLIFILITGYIQGMRATNLAIIFLVYVSLHTVIDYLLSKILDSLDELEQSIKQTNKRL